MVLSLPKNPIFMNKSRVISWNHNIGQNHSMTFHLGGWQVSFNPLQSVSNAPLTAMQSEWNPLVSRDGKCSKEVPAASVLFQGSEGRITEYRQQSSWLAASSIQNHFEVHLLPKRKKAGQKVCSGQLSSSTLERNRLESQEEAPLLTS